MDIGRDYLSEHYRSFPKWAEDNYATGVDGNGELKRYVPYVKLKEYADHERVASFLGSHDRNVDIDKIRGGYLQVFFILVWISDHRNRWTDYIVDFCGKSFDDSHIPLPPPAAAEAEARYSYHARSPFPDTPDGKRAWEAFFEHQWRFIPLRFVDSGQHRIERVHEQTQLDVRHIRPITIDRELPQQPGSSTKLLVISPHESSGLPPVRDHHFYALILELCGADV
jgi:hypothetical protein